MITASITGSDETIHDINTTTARDAMKEKYGEPVRHWFHELGDEYNQYDIAGGYYTQVLGSVFKPPARI